MIYPKISLSAWLKKYPELEVLKKKCDSCDSVMCATTPFIDGPYVGLVAPSCPCGKNRHTCMSMLTADKDEVADWDRLLD